MTGLGSSNIKRMSDNGLLHRVRDHQDNRYQRVHVSRREDVPREAITPSPRCSTSSPKEALRLLWRPWRWRSDGRPAVSASLLSV